MGDLFFGGGVHLKTCLIDSFGVDASVTGFVNRLRGVDHVRFLVQHPRAGGERPGLHQVVDKFVLGEVELILQLNLNNMKHGMAHLFWWYKLGNANQVLRT